MFRAACRASIGLWLMLAPACAADAPARSPAEVMDILMWNREPVGGPFELTDQTGQRRTDGVGPAGKVAGVVTAQIVCEWSWGHRRPVGVDARHGGGGGAVIVGVAAGSPGGGGAPGGGS